MSLLCAVYFIHSLYHLTDLSPLKGFFQVCLPTKTVFIAKVSPFSNLILAKRTLTLPTNLPHLLYKLSFTILHLTLAEIQI